ncbi:MAG: C4-type zinc ribbon domain-containing protein [Bacteroidetes bacterium]|nr:C4-type zinc ribbon domain-containing protein [Bacteroidota bacterium]
MEKRLRLLYALQQVDLQLDELHEMKGDLPGIVDGLRQHVKEKLDQKATLERTAQESTIRRDATDTDIVTLREKIERYKGQQFEVKTNKQYDTLAREIDAAQESVAKLTRDLEALENRTAVARDDAAKLAPEIEQLQAELAERQTELDAVNKEHEEEELRHRHERQKLVARIHKDDLKMYERIRKAKDGKAVVAIKRNACGGCYNKVPPQKALELRRNDIFMMCERCGRLLVSDEVTDGALEL